VGTTLHGSIQQQPSRFADVEIVNEHPPLAVANHRNKALQSPAHRKATFRLLTELHRINSKPLPSHARDFERVM